MRFFKDNALSLVMFGLFVLFIGGESVVGHRTHLEELRDHGEPPITYGAYLRSGDFAEAVFENWESEFLQMGLFVVLASFLRQKGSAQSKPEGENEVDQDPREHARPDSPGPVHRGGLALTLYSRSLSIALLGLFVFSFAMHAVGGQRAFNAEQLQHGGAPVSVLGYLASARFWFESFQNWQSEFLSVFALAVLSIWLRQKGSPESKPVHAPHRETEEA